MNATLLPPRTEPARTEPDLTPAAGLRGCNLDVLCLVQDGQPLSTFNSLQNALREMSLDDNFGLDVKVFDEYESQKFFEHMKIKSRFAEWLIFVPCPEKGCLQFLAKLAWSLALAREKNHSPTRALAVVMSPDSPVKSLTITFLQRMAEKHGSTFRIESIP